MTPHQLKPSVIRTQTVSRIIPQSTTFAETFETESLMNFAVRPFYLPLLYLTEEKLLISTCNFAPNISHSIKLQSLLFLPSLNMMQAPLFLEIIGSANSDLYCFQLHLSLIFFFWTCTQDIFFIIKFRRISMYRERRKLRNKDRKLFRFFHLQR